MFFLDTSLKAQLAEEAEDSEFFPSLPSSSPSFPSPPSPTPLVEGILHNAGSLKSLQLAAAPDVVA